MRSLLLAVLMVCSCVFAPAASAQTPCTIDDEEYAVLAAVLFPNESDVPDGITDDLERKAYLRSTAVRLSGFHGSYYTIEDETITSEDKRSAEGLDRFMVEDYNRNNAERCKIEDAKLLARVPESRRVTLVSAEEMRKSFSRAGKEGVWERFRQRYPLAEGIAYLSRPGFDRSRTEAVVEVRHQAGYTMGVAYRVHLKKSLKTGKWIIKGAVRTRIS